VGDYRAAEEIGQLAMKHQVPRIVLNACRSTHQSVSGETIPRILRDCGIREVLAMSYQISSRGVQFFTGIFYVILFSSLSLPFATYIARRVLQSNMARTSRFGTELEITDYIVPILYRRKSVPYVVNVEMHIGDIIEAAVDSPHTPTEGKTSTSLALGRGRELLRLECMLLEGDRPVVLLGEPGIGKSAVLSDLAKWWTATQCVKGAHAVQLSQYKDVTADKMYRDIHRNLGCPGAYTNFKDLAAFLKTTRCLVIIDSLESMQVHPSTTLARERGELLKFLRALRGGKTLVVFGSRHEIKVFSSYTWPLRLHGLQPLAALKLIRGLLDVSRENVAKVRDMGIHHPLLAQAMQNYGVMDDPVLREAVEKTLNRTDSGLQRLYATWDSEEDGIFLEEMNKLVDGHPLALMLLTTNLLTLGPDVPPKMFFAGLLKGGPLIVDLERLGLNPQGVEGLRSVEEVKLLISNLKATAPGIADIFVGHLNSFWGVFPMRCMSLFHAFERIERGANGKDKTTELLDLVDALASASLCPPLPAETKASIQRLTPEMRKRDPQSNWWAMLQIFNHLEAHTQILDDNPQLKDYFTMMRDNVASFQQAYSADDIAAATNSGLEPLLSSHDGILIAGYARDSVLAQMGKEDSEARQILSSWDTLEDMFASVFDSGPGKALFESVKSFREAFISDGVKVLARSHLIEVPDEDEIRSAGEDPSTEHYMRTSPLLTIIIRGMSWNDDMDKIFECCKVAMALTYARRTSSWPPRLLNRDSEAWRAARSQSDIEFYNVASAVAIGQDCLVDKERSIVVEQAVLEMFTNIEWALETDATRIPIVQLLWETCLEGVKESCAQLEKSEKRPPRKSWVDDVLTSGVRNLSLRKKIGGMLSRMPPEMTSPDGARKGAPDESLTQEQCQTEIRVFDRRRACIGLSAQLLRCYGFSDERSHECTEISSKSVKDLKKDTYPLPLLKDQLKRISGLLDVSTQLGKHYDGQWHIRKLTDRDLVRAISDSVQASLQMSPDGPAGGDEGLALAETREAAAYQQSILEARDKLVSGECDQARGILDGLLEHEMQYGQGNLERRSNILLLRCAVSAKQVRGADALRDLDESRRLADLASGTGKASRRERLVTGGMRRVLLWSMQYANKIQENLGLEPCGFCFLKRGTRRCLGCFHVVYCSKDCQKKSWPEHKQMCKSLLSGFAM